MNHTSDSPTLGLGSALHLNSRVEAQAFAAYMRRPVWQSADRNRSQLFVIVAPEEGFELSADTFDDEPLLRSQQLVFRLVTKPSSGFRTVWQRNGRAIQRRVQ